MISARAVTILDYGIGNIFSVCRAFEVSGAKTRVTSDPTEIASAERLVLPGVGAFEDGMRGLRKASMIDPVREYIRKERPFLGICLGMQMMFDRSYEFGDHEGLGLIPGEVKLISNLSTQGDPLRVPHIGWNALNPTPVSPAWSDTFLKNTAPGTAVYFVHSYSARPKNPEHCLAIASYGGNPIVAAVASGNCFGTQYHPERSGPEGLKMIKAFLDI